MHDRLDVQLYILAKFGEGREENEHSKPVLGGQCE